MGVKKKIGLSLSALLVSMVCLVLVYGDRNVISLYGGGLAFNDSVSVDEYKTSIVWYQEILNKVQALDSDGALDIDARERLLSLYSREDNRRVEAFLLAMERRFLGHDNPQPVLDQQSYADRMTALATYLDSLEGGGNIAQIVDLSMFSSANILDVASQPDSAGMAYRYSLLHLDPLALVGDEGLYTKHNQGGELELDRFSNHYLADRAAMLSWLITQGQLPDSQQVTDYAAKDGHYYKDYASGQEVMVLPDPRDAFQPDVHRVFFGSDGAETLEGNKGNDRLYGGSGNNHAAGRFQ